MELEAEKRVAILAACITLLLSKSRSGAVRTQVVGRLRLWSLASRVDEPPEDWRTPRWGGRLEEEV